jgi:ALG6, ALG8 glycosyltransferase family
VLWVHGIAVNGLGHAYDQNLSFPAVMAWVWGVLAFVQPAFQTAVDSTDTGIRMLMKVPASLADFGLLAVVVYAFRGRPWWAVTAAAVVMFHPAIVDVSAWWGQYESIYVLFALGAVVLAINGHNGPAAVLLVLSVMTKPQALPFLLPFAAWFWATGGIREILRTAVIGIATAVVVWLPFIAAGGPINYLRNLNEYQNVVFPVMSLHAWNIWWIVQMLTLGTFVADQTAVVGPITFRVLGYVITGIVSLIVAVQILRNPTPRTLILGLAASSLVWYVLLTQMHERYAYAALLFLLLLIPERRILALYLVFGVVYTVNLLSAAPPTDWIKALLPFGGLYTIVGSILTIGIAGLTILWMREPPEAETTPDHRVAVAPGVPSV